MAAPGRRAGYNAARHLPEIPAAGPAHAGAPRRPAPRPRPQALAVTPLTFLLVLAGVLLNACAQLLLKAGTNRVGEFAFSLANLVPVGSKLALSPFIAGGLACYVVSV